MKRIFEVVGSAFGGATAGYVVHQIIQKQNDPEGAPKELIIGAPPFTALVAAAIGLLFGRSRAFAFVAGAAIAGSIGDRLDLTVPAMANAKQKLMDLADRKRAAT